MVRREAHCRHPGAAGRAPVDPRDRLVDGELGAEGPRAWILRLHLLHRAVGKVVDHRRNEMAVQILEVRYGPWHPASDVGDEDATLVPAGSARRSAGGGRELSAGAVGHVAGAGVGAAGGLTGNE